jgi:hypothetical protein
MNSTSSPLYCQSYAKWAPIMADRWCGAIDRGVLISARQDVYDAISMHEDQSHWDHAYLGKLYAELDAIRDRQLVVDRRAVV